MFKETANDRIAVNLANVSKIWYSFNKLVYGSLETRFGKKSFERIISEKSS